MARSAPGWKLEWEKGEREDEIIVHVIPDRAERWLAIRST
jgi:hypothetical protein